MPVKLAAVRKAIHQPRGALFSVTRQTVSLIERKVVPSPVSGVSPSSLIGRLTELIASSGSFHFRVGVSDLAEVTRARARPELGEQTVRAILRAPLRDLRRGIVEIAEDDRVRRT